MATPIPDTLEETMVAYKQAKVDIGSKQVNPKVKTEDWSDFSVLGEPSTKHEASLMSNGERMKNLLEKTSHGGPPLACMI